MNTDAGIQLDLVGALRRRGILIVVVAASVFLIGYWIAMALPNQYKAHATLLVEPQAVSKMFVQPGVGATDLNDRLHLMTAEILSRPRLSKVIDELSLYGDESRSMTRQELIGLMRQKVAVVPVLPELEASLRSRREIEINTFKVQFIDQSPTVAAEVAQRLANDFIEEHIQARVAVSQKSLDFVAAEQASLSQDIARVEARIATVKDENPGRLPEDLAPNQRSLEITRSSLRAAQRDIDSARSDEAFWSAQALDTSELSGSGERSPTQKLAILELSLDALRARGLTDKHPEVIYTIKEIDEVRATISEDEGAPPEEGTNPTQRAALAQARRAGQRVDTILREIARLEEEQEALQVKIEGVPRVAEQLEALARQHRNLTESLRDFNNRRLEAEVQANLERRQLGEQFRVLEPAYAPSEPSSPNRLVILVVGLMMGVSLGVAAAVVAESADSSVHGAQQLQGMVGIPVLVSIPTILLPPDIAARRRRFARNVVAAGALAFFCLAGGAATYVFVNGSPISLFGSGSESEPGSEPVKKPAPAPAPAPAPSDTATRGTPGRQATG